MYCYRFTISLVLLLGLVACHDEGVKDEQGSGSKTESPSKSQIAKGEIKTEFPVLAGISVGMEIKQLLPILNASIKGKADGEAFDVVKCEDVKLKFPPQIGAVYAITLHDKYTLAEADKSGKVTLIRLPGVLVDELYDCSGTPPEFVVEKVADACHVKRLSLCKPFRLLHPHNGSSQRQSDRMTKKRGWGLKVANRYSLRISEDKDILYEMQRR